MSITLSPPFVVNKHINRSVYSKKALHERFPPLRRGRVYVYIISLFFSTAAVLSSCSIKNDCVSLSVMLTISRVWKQFLYDELCQDYVQEIKNFLAKEYLQKKVIYPPPEKIFKSLSFFPPEETSVVLVGQDPYYGEGQAHGLSFSVPDGVKIPPSLSNIFQEIADDLGDKTILQRSSGSLYSWAQQGVLLLNATLSVEKGRPGSHQKIGWETLTAEILRKLSHSFSDLVFLLWGSSAQRHCLPVISTGQGHKILTTSHPSPLSVYRGFSGCRHFSKTNAFLISRGKKSIQWV